MSSQATRSFPPVYKEALERAIVDCFDLDDVDEALCARYFRDEMVAVESESELHDDDKVQDDEYELQAISFIAGWQAQQRYHSEKRLEAQIEDIIKKVS